MNTAEKEQAKYEEMWTHDEYRNRAPAERLIWPFLLTVQPQPKSTICDFGSGTGRGALFLHEAGFDMTCIDIADNSMDDKVKQVLDGRFIQGNIWKDLSIGRFDYIFCTDVMEHIPEDYIDAVLHNINKHSKEAFMNIAFYNEPFGDLINETLHMTIKPFMWWVSKIAKVLDIVEAKDMIEEGIFYVKSTYKS